MIKRNMQSLKDTRIIIVGASYGIGLCIARIYAQGGAQLGLMARSDGKMSDLQAMYPGQIKTAYADITRPEGAHALSALADALGGMDIYLHVAGIGYDNPEGDPEVDAAYVNTDATGAVRMIRTAYEYFARNKRRGHIAAVTSVAGTKGLGSMAAYSAAKRCVSTYLVALEQLAHTAHVPVSFTDIRPGWTGTGLLHAYKRYMLQMDVDKVAGDIVRAIAKRRRVAIIDRRWHILVALWRCIPNAIWIRLNPKFIE